MKHVFSILIISLFSLSAYGQLYTMSDHYMHNALAINPAYSGSHDAISSIIGYRRWNGFEWSPSTMLLSIHTPLNNEKIGLGLFIMNDKYGISNETSFVGNYAYRMNVGDGKLALGLGFGMIINKADWGSLEARDADDELLTETSSTGVMPDFSLGMYYSTNKYFIGLSAPLFLSHEYQAETDKFIIKNDFKEYNYFLNGGYIVDINPAIKFFPSVLLRYNQGNAPQIDIGSQLILKDKVWVGAAYRSEKTMIAMLQCQVNKQLRIAFYGGEK